MLHTSLDDVDNHEIVEIIVIPNVLHSNAEEHANVLIDGRLMRRTSENLDSQSVLSSDESDPNAPALDNDAHHEFEPIAIKFYSQTCRI